MNSIAINDIALVGVNYHNANLIEREKLSIPHDEASSFLTNLRDRELSREGVVLSTCNRTELYCLSSHPDLILAEIISRSGRQLDSLRELFYIKRGRETIAHAFHVASGLDSMILGEPEILGQMKKAFAAAQAGSFVGTSLHQLFERAFNVAKKIRTKTEISREAVSAPAVCAKQAEHIFGELSGCTVLCIGAGTIIETALNHFAAHQPSSLTIANRTQSHARDLAASHNAQVIPYEDITNELHHYDIILTATSSVLPVIGKGAIERALRQRRRRPIAVFDLAVPRDVETEAGELEDLFLYTIDDIGELTGVNMAKRRAAADSARSYIDTATEQLIEWFERRDAVDVIKSLRERFEHIRTQEYNDALAALRSNKDPQAVIKQLAQRLTNRLAHDPLQTLNEQHANRDLIDELSNWYRNDQSHNAKDPTET